MSWLNTLSEIHLSYTAHTAQVITGDRNNSGREVSLRERTIITRNIPSQEFIVVFTAQVNTRSAGSAVCWPHTQAETGAGHRCLT